MHNTGTIPLYHDMLGRFASSRKLNVSVNHMSPVGSVVRAVAVHLLNLGTFLKRR